MQEFSSVTASSYDAESLAPMLTEKAAEGWSVVSIVSAGTNVVAYLVRVSGRRADDHAGAEAPAAIVGVSDDATDAQEAFDSGAPAADADVADVTVDSSPTLADSDDSGTDDSDDSGTDDSDDSETDDSEAATDSPTSPWSTDAAADDAPTIATDAAAAASDDQFSDGMGAVAGGAGLGADTGDLGGAALSGAELTDVSDTTPTLPGSDVGTDTADTTTAIGTDAVADSGDATIGLAGGVTAASDDTQVIGDSAASADDAASGAAEHAGAAASMAGDTTTQDTATEDTSTTEDAPASDTSTSDDTTSDGDAQASDTATDTATDTAGESDAPGVPAGWYADPSGRYELRYWDGSAWTEHVSRAGQQYTDPPVA